MYSYLVLLFVISFQTFSFTKLEFIDDLNIKTSTKTDEHPFGGISGLSYSNKSQMFIAISDDRSVYSPARIFPLKMKLDSKKLSVTVQKAMILKNSAGKDFKINTIDFEGIAILDDNNVIISSEGTKTLFGYNPPMIAIFNNKGKIIQKLPIPNHYLSGKKQGIRKNRGFESLSLTSDKNFLFTATETALKQDYKKIELHEKIPTRILRYKRKNKNFKVDSEFIYYISPVTKKPAKGDVGVAEILALSKNEILVLERAWFSKGKRKVRIYKAFLNKFVGTHKNLRIVKKELFVDLDDYKSQLSPNFRNFDNIEGMSFGPRLKNNDRTLILISDNNFNKKQRTQILAFKVVP